MSMGNTRVSLSQTVVQALGWRMRQGGAEVCVLGRRPNNGIGSGHFDSITDKHEALRWPMVSRSHFVENMIETSMKLNGYQ